MRKGSLRSIRREAALSSVDPRMMIDLLCPSGTISRTALWRW